MVLDRFAILHFVGIDAAIWKRWLGHRKFGYCKNLITQKGQYNFQIRRQNETREKEVRLSMKVLDRNNAVFGKRSALIP